MSEWMDSNSKSKENEEKMTDEDGSVAYENSACNRGTAIDRVVLPIFSKKISARLYI